MNISNLLTAFTLLRGEHAQEVLVPVPSGAEFEAGLALPDAVSPIAIAKQPVPKAATLDALIAQAEVAAQEAEVAPPVSWQTLAPDTVESAEISVQPPLQPDDPVTFDAAMAYSLFLLPLPTNEPKPSCATIGALAASASQGPNAMPDLHQANPLADRVFSLDATTGMQVAVWPVALAKQMDLVGDRSVPLAQSDQAVLTGQMVESARQTSARVADGAAEGQGGNEKASADKPISQGPSVDRLESARSPSVRSLEQGQAVQAPSAAANGALPPLEPANTDAPHGLVGVVSGLGLAPRVPTPTAKNPAPRLAAVNKETPQGLDVEVSGSGQILQSPSAAPEGDGPRAEAVSKDTSERVEGVASGLGWSMQGARVLAQVDVLSLEALKRDAPKVSGVVPIELVLVSQATSLAAKGDGPRRETVSKDAGQGLDVGAVAKTAIAGPEARILAHFNAPSGAMDALPLLAALAVPDPSQGPKPAGQTIPRLGMRAASGLRAPNLGMATQSKVDSSTLRPVEGDPRLGLTAPPTERPMKGAFAPVDMIGGPNSSAGSAPLVTGGGLNAAPLLPPDSPSAPLPKAALTLHANMPAVIAHLHQGPAREGHSHAELLMNPAELGRIRFDLTTQGDQVQVTLSVERPETLDLLRANAEALRQEFRAAGLNTDTLNFGQWAQRAPSRDQTEVLPEQGLGAAVPQAVSAPYVKPMSSSGLDLRL